MRCSHFCPPVIGVLLADPSCTPVHGCVLLYRSTLPWILRGWALPTRLKQGKWNECYCKTRGEMFGMLPASEVWPLNTWFSSSLNSQKHVTKCGMQTSESGVSLPFLCSSFLSNQCSSVQVTGASQTATFGLSENNCLWRDKKAFAIHYNAEQLFSCTLWEGSVFICSFDELECCPWPCSNVLIIAVWRSQPVISITFLGGRRRGCLHSFVWYIQIHGLGCRFCTWITCWLLWLNRIWPAFKQCNLGLSNADVQISSGESSCGSRAGSNFVLELKAELKSQWADLHSWMSMAFIQERARGAWGEEAAASAIHRAPGCSGWLFWVRCPAGAQPMFLPWPQLLRVC